MSVAIDELRYRGEKKDKGRRQGRSEKKGGDEKGNGQVNYPEVMAKRRITAKRGLKNVSCA